MIIPLVASGLVLTLVVVFVTSMRFPLVALRWLLVLLPLHSAGVLLFRNVVGAEPLLVTLGGAWKEAVIVGLLAASAMRLHRARTTFAVPHWTALALLATITIRAVLDLMTADEPMLVLYAARQLAEFLLVFVAVAFLQPSPRWLLRTATLVMPVLAFSAVFAIAQPGLGVGFYDQYFHAPGERLHHSYLVNIGEMRRLRAVGTFIAPNEFGLGLLVYGAAFVAPLLAMVRRWWIVLSVLMLACMALLLTFSRSAWFGVGVGSIAAGALGVRYLLRLRRQGKILTTPLRQLVLGAAAAFSGSAALFIAIGGATLLITTIAGTESSAAGRGESIGRGVEATLENLGGLGLGTAGPLALERAGRAILTENWFLLYAVQLGLIPLMLLVVFCGSSLIAVAHRALNLLRAAESADAGELDVYAALVSLGTTCALVGAVAGALVIPALLDLPASIALWTLVAIVLGWQPAASSDS